MTVAKTKFFYVVFLIILLLPALLLIFKNPIYPSHDAQTHIRRIEFFNESLTSGQFPPRLVKEWGFPIFVVNYQLPYYFAEVFFLASNDATVAFKSVIALTFILSALFSFLFFSKRGSYAASLAGAMVFSYAPYRFANIYTRGALGESVALMFVPLVLLAVEKIRLKDKYALVFLTFSIFGLITSHLVIFLLFLPFFVLYLFFALKLDKNLWKNVLLAVALGCLMSSFELGPAIFEKRFVRLEKNFFTDYKDHFLPLSSVLRIPIGKNVLGTPFQIGAVSSAIMLLSLYLAIVKRKFHILFFLLTAAFSIYLTSSYSVLVWDNLPFLRYLVFPWRFLSVAIFCAAFLCVYVVDSLRLKKIVFLVIIFAAIFTSRHYFLSSGQKNSTPPPENTSVATEYDTIWTNKFTFEKGPLVSSAAEMQIANVFENASKVTFNADSQSSSLITVRKVYFPGWNVLINNSYYEVKQKDGLISFEIPKGKSNVELIFRETAIGYLSNFLSAFSLIGFTFIILYLMLKEKFVENWKHFT